MKVDFKITKIVQKLAITFVIEWHVIKYLNFTLNSFKTILTAVIVVLDMIIIYKNN